MTLETNVTLPFLQGGGEMGELTRKYDWSTTPIGSPETWPQSLRTMVGVMLNNPFGMYIAWGKEYTQLYNDGYRPILGALKHPAALGISTRETFSEIWHIIGSMFDGVMKGHPVGFPDFMLPLNRNGYVEECYFDFSYSPIMKEDGQIGGVLVTVIETTNKKKAEDALKESEVRFRTMADNIPNLAFMGQANGDIFWYNQKWYEYSGSTPEQMKGWGWSALHHPNHLSFVMEKWKKSLVEGQPFEMVFPLKGADGKFRQFLTRILPVRDGNGNIYNWFGTSTDVTDRIEAEEKLKKSQENLRNIILQAPVAMCIFEGPEYIVEIANDKMFELWGKAPEEVMNKPIFVGLPEARNQGLENLLFNVYTTGETFKAYGLPVNLPRGGQTEIIYISFVYEAFRNGDGTIGGVMAVAIDVTEQVIARNKIEEIVARRTEELGNANAELTRTNMQLAQSNKNLEDFAYAASHDLKEPVRKIHFFSDRLKVVLDDRLTEEERVFFGRMGMAARRMSTLIEDLLTYSTINLKPKELEVLDLNTIMDLVLADLDLEIDQKKAIITVHDLCKIKGHSRQMQQAFQNLISNALKYSKNGNSPEIEITCTLHKAKEVYNGNRVEALKNKDYYEIVVSDNGIGFDQQDADKIFNVFTRLQTSSDYKGTGIGLAIVRKVIENHQGMIKAYSEPGEGASFKIYFPAISEL